MLRAEVVAAMSKPEIRKPCPSANRDTAKIQKQHSHGNASWLIREAVATVTIGLLVAVVMWASILGMSEGFQPGPGVVVGPIAENDHAK